MNHSLFISDLHLTPERPGPAGLFRRFLEERAIHADALYILGDFFEAWVGDDDLENPFHADLAAQLKRLAARGVKLGFIAGNRDFLAGERLAASAGFTLLPDPMRLNLYGVPTLLAHGDVWCSDDAAYQAYRAQVRQPAWQAQFLELPLAERRIMAAALRDKSEQSKADKRPEIMDVNPQAIADAFALFDVQRIIHGHTHRPARHLHEVDGALRERWVLPDWYDKNAGYLLCDRQGCRAEAL